MYTQAIFYFHTIINDDPENQDTFAEHLNMLLPYYTAFCLDADMGDHFYTDTVYTTYNYHSAGHIQQCSLQYVAHTAL